MANNLIQIKRTSVTGRAANSTTLTNAGELAINMTDGIMYSTNGTTVFEVGANLTNSRITNSLTIDNAKALRFITVNSSANVYFTQQNDDNFVFYSTNATYGARPVWGIFANSTTSNLQVYVPLQLNSSLVANSSNGSAGQVLTSNGTGVYWSSAGGGSGTVTSVATGNGMTGGPVTTTGTVSVLANSGITANATGLYVTQGTGVTVNTTGVHVNGTYVQNTDSRTLSGNLIISGTYFNPSTNTILLGNSTQRWVVSGNSIDLSGSMTSSIGANSIILSNATSNWIWWNTTGVAAPSVTTRSAGTKLALYPSLSGTQVDYAIGIESNHLWFSTDNATTGTKWYANTTNYMTANIAGLYHSGTVNAASHTVGTSTVANATGVYTGIVNAASHTVGTSTVANATGVYTGIVNGATIQVGTSFTANATLVNTAAINVTNQVNSATIYATTSANIASAVQANATGLWTTGTVNAATVQTGTTFIANSTQVTIGAVPLYANSSSGTAGQVLTTSATGVYWAAAAGGGYYKGGSAAVGTLAVGGQNIFRVNANTLNNSTTIAAGENATAAGPLVVASGISLVVDTGGRVVIT